MYKQAWRYRQETQHSKRKRTCDSLFPQAHSQKTLSAYRTTLFSQGRKKREFSMFPKSVQATIFLEADWLNFSRDSKFPARCALHKTGEMNEVLDHSCF